LIDPDLLRTRRYRVPVLTVLRQYKYTGKPNAINANPIADCFGLFQIVVRISHVQIAMNRTGTTG